MTDLSPIQLLEETHSLLVDLHKKIDLLNQNVNILNSKANNQLFPKQINPNPQAIAINSPTNIKPTASLPKPMATKVFGTVYSQDQVPIAAAVVKITNSDKQPVKTLKTDHQGKWTTTLPPGKYSLKYMSDKMPTSYRIVQIKDGQDLLEVL